MQHSLRPTANSKDIYVPKGKPSVRVAVNVGNNGQRRAAHVFHDEVTLCVGKCAVAELLQYQKRPLPSRNIYLNYLYRSGNYVCRLF